MIVLALLIVALYLLGVLTIHFLLVLAVLFSILWLVGWAVPRGPRGPGAGRGWYGRSGYWW